MFWKTVLSFFNASPYKTDRAVILSVAVAISAERHVPQLEGAGEGTGPRLQAPDFNSCYNYAESVNPVFDPRRVLLLRTLFINEDCSKYLSVGYYPARDYQPLVDFGASTKILVILTRTCADIRGTSTLNMRGHV